MCEAHFENHQLKKGSCDAFKNYIFLNVGPNFAIYILCNNFNLLFIEKMETEKTSRYNVVLCIVLGVTITFLILLNHFQNIGLKIILLRHILFYLI